MTAALVVETAPTGVLPLLVAATRGALCGAQVVDAYQCYAESPAKP